MILKKNLFLYLNFIFLITLSNLTWTKANRVKIIQTENDLLTSYLDSNKPAIIFCSMNNCPHCEMVKPAFNKIASQEKYGHITFALANGPKLHIHEHVKRETDGKFKIPGYPVFLFIKDKKIKNVIIGADKDKLNDEIKSFNKTL